MLCLQATRKKKTNLILSVNFLLNFLNAQWAIQWVMQSVFELEMISNSNCYFAYSLRGFCHSGARAAGPSARSSSSVRWSVFVCFMYSNVHPPLVTANKASVPTMRQKKRHLSVLTAQPNILRMLLISLLLSSSSCFGKQRVRRQ